MAVAAGLGPLLMEFTPFTARARLVVYAFRMYCMDTRCGWQGCEKVDSENCVLSAISLPLTILLGIKALSRIASLGSKVLKNLAKPGASS